MSSSTVKMIKGGGISVRGNDIDTDRIIPARFMKEITFENLGQYAFADERAAAKKAGGLHAFDDPRYAGGSVLIVNKAFGSGSSREHAPQALMRWGIKAVIGESFAEIFFGNCTTLGIPCVSLPQADIEALQAAIEAQPNREVIIDVEHQRVICGDKTYASTQRDAARKALVEGTWDATGMLLANKDAIAATAARLPYLNQFGA